MNRRIINAPRFMDQSSTSFASHLRKIVNHTARLKTKRKNSAKERAKYNEQFNPKPPPKHWSFRVNDKGTGIITIRKRKEKFLYENEYKEMLEAHPSDLKIIQETLARKKIPIKPTPEETKDET